MATHCPQMDDVSGQVSLLCWPPAVSGHVWRINTTRQAHQRLDQFASCPIWQRESRAVAVAVNGHTLNHLSIAMCMLHCVIKCLIMWI